MLLFSRGRVHTRGAVVPGVQTCSLPIFIAPLLAGLFIHSGMEVSGGFLMDAIGSVALELLAPFVIGHLMRPLIGGYVDRHRLFLGRLDRGSILLVVYTAFSAAVIEGLWHRLSGFDL